MAGRTKKRKIAPCKDREATYEMMAGWTFQEVEKVNYDLLDWLEKTLLVFRPSLSPQTPAITSKRFMEFLADGVALSKLASRLCLSLNDNYKRFPSVNERYAHFCKFSRAQAKLAEGCIFTEEELLGETYEDYKSVFYTLFKLASQARDKFGAMALVETREIDWAELRKRRKELRTKDTVVRGDHSKALPIKKILEEITAWTFDRVNKANYDVLKWLEGEMGILFHPVPQSVTPQAFLIALQSHGYEHIYEYLKSSKSQWEECIFWEEELFGNTYDDYKLVFSVLCPDHIVDKAIAMSYRGPSTNTNATADYYSNNMKFIVFVKTLTGKKFPLECSPLDTVYRIKERINQTEGIPEDQQRLIYAGRQMEEDRRLEDYNVQNECTLELILRMRGC